MSEIIFQIHEAEEGGFWAEALGYSIFTQGETWEELKEMVKEAVGCYFESPEERPKIIRLHFVRDEVIAAWNFRVIATELIWQKRYDVLVAKLPGKMVLTCVWPVIFPKNITLPFQITSLYDLVC